MLRGQNRNSSLNTNSSIPGTDTSNTQQTNLTILRQENARLREEVAYLNSKCEEFLLDKNDDALVAVFKRKINMLENNLEETETEYEEKLTLYKKKYNDAQRENLELQKRIRDLGFDDANREIKQAYESQIAKLEDELELKNNQLQKQLELNAQQNQRYVGLKEKAKELISKAKNGNPMTGKDNSKTQLLKDLEKDSPAKSSGDVSNDPEKPTRFKLKNMSNKNSRRGSVMSNKSNQSGDGQKNQPGGLSETLKDNSSFGVTVDHAAEQFKLLIAEKKRLERINDDLSKRLLTSIKETESQFKDNLEKEKKRNEHQIAYLSNELNLIKEHKDSNEKKLLAKIRNLEQKLDERENQMNILGSGIEALNQELKMREDPSQNAIEVVTYLEKFAKYQNDFMMREIRSFQEDYTKLKDETYGKMNEAEDIREVNLELAKKLDKQNQELEMYKEMMSMKDEETKLFEKERRNYILALENIRKDGSKLTTLTKQNDDLNNQVVHYKGLVRRLNAANNNNALNLYGPDGKALPLSKFDEFGKPIHEQLIEAQVESDSGEFLDLVLQFSKATSTEQACLILRKVYDDQEVLKEGFFHIKKLEGLINDAVNYKDKQVIYCGLKTVAKCMNNPKFTPDKIYSIVPANPILEGFTPIDIQFTGMSKNEIMMNSLEILGSIFKEPVLWGDDQSGEMIRGLGLKFVASKIVNEKEMGQGSALQALCLITNYKALIPEFLNQNVMNPILKLLHSKDPKIRRYCGEIIKNFSITDKMLVYVDKLDLLRNLIDSFYANDSFSMISLLLDCFINISEYPQMKQALMTTELCDKVCWLLTRKDDNYKDIRERSIRLLISLISESTIDRVVKILKGNLKLLLNERDTKLVFSSLYLLKRILEFDKTHKIVDFELIQSLILSLGHSEDYLFDISMEILSELRILDENVYMKMMFTMDGIMKLIEVFPKLNDPAKINFCLSVLFQFTHDPKTAGAVMIKGGAPLYEALYNNLHRADSDSKLLILKILFKLLKYSSSSGPLEKFPDWNCLLDHLNLSYNNIRPKEFDLFAEASVILLLLSSKENFIQKVDLTRLFTSFNDGIEREVYEDRELEMKGIILEIITNIFMMDGEQKAEKLNNLFRNQKFNFIWFILKLFEPYFMTNENWQFAEPIFQFLSMICTTPLFQSLLKLERVKILTKLESLYISIATPQPKTGEYILKILGTFKQEEEISVPKTMVEIERDREILQEELKLMEREIAKRKEEEINRREYLRTKEGDDNNRDLFLLNNEKELQRKKELEVEKEKIKTQIQREAATLEGEKSQKRAIEEEERQKKIKMAQDQKVRELENRQVEMQRQKQEEERRRQAELEQSTWQDYETKVPPVSAEPVLNRNQIAADRIQNNPELTNPNGTIIGDYAPPISENKNAFVDPQFKNMIDQRVQFDPRVASENAREREKLLIPGNGPNQNKNKVLQKNPSGANENTSVYDPNEEYSTGNRTDGQGNTNYDEETGEEEDGEYEEEGDYEEEEEEEEEEDEPVLPNQQNRQQQGGLNQANGRAPVQQNQNQGQRR